MPYGSDPTTPPATPRWNDYPLVKDDDLPPLVPLTQADAAARSMGWEVVSQMPVSRWQNAPLADKTPVVSVPKGEAKNLSDAKPGGIYVTVPAGTHQGTAPASGTELPPEADLLYNKVRRAEGTADNPWKVYGGDPFAPGREHPGEAARRVDPKTGKVTHAAGPGQWEPDTWNGLKPDFQARFGRNPDFSSDDDQRAMTWLNASKVYPGGEARLREDLKSGKLNTESLAYQWTGFGAKDYGGPWNVIGAGKWQVSTDALRHGTSIPDAAVQWLDPLDYLAMLPPLEGDAANRAKRTSLQRSVNAGEEIQDLPSLDVKREGNKFKVIDYDGRNRAELALKEGVGLIPVVIRGVGKGDKPSEIEGLSGKTFPYDFKPVIYTPPPPPPRKWWEKVGSGIGTGIVDPAIGAAQIGARIEQMPGAGIPEQPLAPQPPDRTAEVDRTIQDREAAYQAQRRSEGDTGVDWGRLLGNVIGTAPLAVLPGAGAIGAGGNALARIGGAALGGALAGGAGAAVSPVTTPGNFAAQKTGQIGEGMVLGGALGGGGSALATVGGAGVNALRSVVSPTTVTQAAARLFGENADRLTPEFLAGIRSRTGATLERIEKGHDIDIGRDTRLLADLDAVKGEARDLLGDEHYGGAAAPIVRAIDGILSRASEEGVISGKSAATLWHWGSPLDRLTDSANRDVAGLAQRAQTAIRGALNRQLPPDEAALYSAARHQWRDLRIVEKTLKPGETQLNPQRFVARIYKKFPGQASQPGGPAILQLGRAIGETWPGSFNDSLGAAVVNHLSRRIVGHALGAGVGFAAGGPVGGVAGTVAGHLALNALARLRMASPNALRALRPPPAVPPNTNALLALARAAQQAPAVAAPALSYEIAR